MIHDMLYGCTSIFYYFSRCVEMAKLKCAQYWPDEGKASATFDNITVSVTEHELKGSFEFRKLSVQCDVCTCITHAHHYLHTESDLS